MQYFATLTSRDLVVIDHQLSVEGDILTELTALAILDLFIPFIEFCLSLFNEHIRWTFILVCIHKNDDEEMLMTFPSIPDETIQWNSQREMARTPLCHRQ